MQNKSTALFLALLSFSAIASDHTRPVENGERIILTEKYGYISSDYPGSKTYRVILDESVHTREGIRRQDVAVINGCINKICVGNKVIELSTKSEVEIVGLTYTGRFMILSGNAILGPVAEEDLARTKGCTTVNYKKVCVGKIISSGTYGTVISKVIGITSNKELVLEQIQDQ